MAKEAVPLSIMLGAGEPFMVGDRTYHIFPITLQDVPEFTSGRFSIGPQLFNMINADSRANLDKWIQKQIKDEQGQPMTLDRCVSDGWTVRDLRKSVETLLDISG